MPDDYVESPKVLETIKDPDYRQWAKDLNALWLDLGRKMTDDVAVSFATPNARNEISINFFIRL